MRLFPVIYRKKVLFMAMKRANGDGSIYKIGGKRRKPWGARITTGWRLDPASGKLTQEYQLIGTFRSVRPLVKGILRHLEE